MSQSSPTVSVQHPVSDAMLKQKVVLAYRTDANPLLDIPTILVLGFVLIHSCIFHQDASGLPLVKAYQAVNPGSDTWTDKSIDIRPDANLGDSYLR